MKGTAMPSSIFVQITPSEIGSDQILTAQLQVNLQSASGIVFGLLLNDYDGFPDPNAVNAFPKYNNPTPPEDPDNDPYKCAWNIQSVSNLNAASPLLFQAVYFPQDGEAPGQVKWFLKYSVASIEHEENGWTPVGT